MMKRLGSILVILLLLGLMNFCGKDRPPADLVLLNGKVVTLEKDQPQADAIAVQGDKILAVGSTKNIKGYISDKTQVIDVRGMLVIPGMIESHGHFTSLGYAKMRLDLTKAQNWQEIVSLVAEAAKKANPGAWILGRGWHQEKWDKTPQPNVDGLPFHHELSKVSPENPVMLSHASGHSCFANAKAMELAGINARTPNPEGGEIVKDGKGNPIGVFRETAQRLLRRRQAHTQSTQTEADREAELLRAMKLAEAECLKKGISTFHDAGVSFATVDFYRKLVKKGELGIRIYAMLNESNTSLKERIKDYWIIGEGNNHLTVRSIKRLIDGALGAHGAWLLKPYKSMPSSVGLNTESIENMKETAQIAIENGFQLNTHAIGDRGNRETLDIYEEAFKKYPEKKDLRWRIEHAQHLHPQDIPRFGQLGVIPSMQGIHCTSDAPWVFKRLGEKRAEEGAYVWQKLMKSGAIICNGTDVPVEDVDPLACYYATVTRRLKDGSVFFGDQKMSREEALRSYTINGAYAAFEENIKGSLKVGKLADITVLDKDILTIPDEEILKTTVMYTIVAGKVLYKK